MVTHNHSNPSTRRVLGYALGMTLLVTMAFQAPVTVSAQEDGSSVSSNSIGRLAETLPAPAVGWAVGSLICPEAGIAGAWPGAKWGGKIGFWAGGVVGGAVGMGVGAL